MKSIYSSSADFYNKKTINSRDKFFQTYTTSDHTTKDLISIATDKLNSLAQPKILDIGTGNGFVLNEVAKNLNKRKKSELVGIDLSPEMVKRAKTYCADYNGIIILEADNFSIPFADNYFDVVTNKLSTNFSVSEVFRVLKKGGLFIFKEYGLLKGMGVIAETFKDRVNVIDPVIYLKKIRDHKPQNMMYSQFYFEKSYTKDEIRNILAMAPIIRDFNEKKDMKIIKSLFAEGNITITSDPFLIVVVK
ncbi:hypothetical protein A2982_04115 [candidate division WWE3 bacterium RIFCSPLOWO2_01_FULL_39_13]|uniref:Methyltransferase type 11 domain-containing protein n=1 Tax=candidate division WWE3 bacterium RIFCSPLOWO2_01_FULL_39_13 TaxID=1802624 RepID=A0A1F4V215_UNCKA|nr:MAG: hypothetical protein A2982_04115 [candidate division WWE3 bacterium RIFCSPLOWO2_01_FULL_39_13]